MEHLAHFNQDDITRQIIKNSRGGVGGNEYCLCHNGMSTVMIYNHAGEPLAMADIYVSQYGNGEAHIKWDPEGISEVTYSVFKITRGEITKSTHSPYFNKDDSQAIALCMVRAFMWLMSMGCRGEGKFPDPSTLR